MTTPKRALSTRHASLPIALIVLLLAAPLAPASAQAGSRIALSEAQVACNSAQLGALLSRTRVTSPDGTVPPLPQSLLVSYSNRFGFYEGLVVGLPRFRPSVEPPVFPPEIPGPEHQLAYHLDPSVRELLLNPERTPLEQVSLTRETSTSNLVEPGDPFAVVVAVDPTLGPPAETPGPADLVIDNLEGGRAADTKPGRGLTESGLTDLCHTLFTPVDRRVFAILQRALRVEVFDPLRELRYDTRIALYRAEDPEEYRAAIHLVDPETGELDPTPLVAHVRVEVDSGGALAGGRLTVPEHVHPDRSETLGRVMIVEPLFGGVESEYAAAVAYPIGGPLPAAPETFWNFDWSEVLEETAWNLGPPTATEACGHGTAQEIAATPRANPELEHMALDMGGGLTADPAVYDRVVADVSAIRSSFPELPEVRYVGRWRPDQLILSVTPAAFRQIEAGAYDAWNCLNTWYELEQTDLAEHSDRWLVLTFDGVYDVPVLAADYAALPGIAAAEPNGTGADGSELCGSIEGTTHHYVVRQASGDCPAGCTREGLTHFTSAPGQVPEPAGTWTSGDPAPRPAWAEGCGPR